jgi:hypothetical protein
MRQRYDVGLAHMQPEATKLYAKESRQGAGRLPRIVITYTCTNCGCKGTVRVKWSEHHTIPPRWKSRDVGGSHMLPRRTDHIFACSAKCLRSLDKKFPPLPQPKWFSAA